MYIIEECRGLEVERSRLEEAVPAKFRWDLFWLDWQSKGPFNEFLLTVRDRFIEAGPIRVGSTQSVSRESREEGGGAGDSGRTLRGVGGRRG